MEYTGCTYFAERSRRIEELMPPHLIEKERPYRIVTEIELHLFILLLQRI